MRNPRNSWEKSDSDGDTIGPQDEMLMMSLAYNGPVHAKYRRMIVVYADILAPLYWWKEFDTYKVGTVANSCSTMHKISAKTFELDDFSHEHMDASSLETLEDIIRRLNLNREEFVNWSENDAAAAPKKDYWWQMIQLLPSSYNQLRTVMMNYEVLSNIYRSRKGHKLDEWRQLCKWIETLPHSNIITIRDEGD